MTSLNGLSLINFRNYERFIWEPKRQKVVVFGPNGSGKTNLLEALSLLVSGRGLRRSLTEAFIKNDKQDCGWGIQANIHNDLVGTYTISTGCLPNSIKRQFRLNGQPLKNQHSLSKHLSIVWLTPQMDRLFLEGSSGRRRFLDRLIFSSESYHSKEIAAYEKSMSQRNKLLAEKCYDHLWLNAIEESMACHAVAIAATRNLFVKQLNQLSSFSFPDTELVLNCPISENLDHNPALIVEDNLREYWKNKRFEDAEHKLTRYGVHRSDVVFRDKYSLFNANLVSTGQQKALLVGIILKLCEYIKIKEKTLPFLLLDEPLVHLDVNYRAALLNTLDCYEGFVISTGTDKAPFETSGQDFEFLNIDQGIIV